MIYLKYYVFILFYFILQIVNASKETGYEWSPCSSINYIDETFSTGFDDLFATHFFYNYYSHLNNTIIVNCILLPVPFVYDILNKTIPPRVFTSEMNIFIKHYSLKNESNLQTSTLVLFDDILYPNSYYTEILSNNLYFVHKNILQNIDIYIIHPRGTGRSTRLNCPLSQIYEKGSMGGSLVTEEELVECIHELYHQYPSRDSSGNLYSLIKRENSMLNNTKYTQQKEKTKQNGTMIFSTIQSTFDFYYIARELFSNSSLYLYANHGSTLILTHILQLHPYIHLSSSIEGIIYDNALDINIYDKQTYIDIISTSVNKAGETYLNECLQFPICAKLLSNDPRSVFDSLYDSNQEKHCPFLFSAPPIGMGLQPASINILLTHILLNPYTRRFLPQVTLEILKCKANDMSTLISIIKSNKYLFRGTLEINADNSLLNRMNILFSELSNPNIEQFIKLYMRDMEDKESVHLFTLRYSKLLTFYKQFPKYTIPKEYLIYPQTNISLLFLTGSGPIYQSKQPRNVYSQIKSPHKYWVRISTSYSFKTIFESPLVHSGLSSRQDCGIHILLSFIQDEQHLHTIDQSCLQNVLYSFGYPESSKTSVSETLYSLDLDAKTEYIQNSLSSIMIAILSTILLCTVICFVPLVILYLIYQQQ